MEVGGDAKRLLFSLLRELKEEDLKRFQSLLAQRLHAAGEPGLPKRRPKKSEYMAIVGQMVGKFGEDQALAVTVDLLSQISTQISEQLLRASQTYLDQRLYEKQEKARHKKKYTEDLIDRFRLQEDNIDFGQVLDLKNRYPKLLRIKNYCQEEGFVHEILSRRKKHQEAWVEESRNSYSNVTELFEACQNGHTPRIVVLQGAAGIGKTTLARKIMLDWASRKLYQDKFDYMFYLQCRDIDKHHAPLSVGDLLVQSCSEVAPHTVGLFNDPRKLLFIIDGFDELRCPVLVSEDEHPPTADTQSTLIRRTLLCKSSVIITTRTTALEKLRKCVRIQQLKEILGYSQEDIEEYIHLFFRDFKLGGQTWQRIHEKVDLLSMCFVPVVCWIVCNVIKQHVEKGEEYTCASDTMTLVYLAFFERSLVFDQTSDSVNHMQCSLKKLCSLAKDGVYDKKLLFEEEDIGRYDLTFSDIQSLFQNKAIFHRAAKEQNLYCFGHLSLQEFFAALFFVLRQNEGTDTQPDVMDLVADYRRPGHKHLLLTVHFVFGLLNPEATKRLEKTLKWKVSSEIKKDLFHWIKEGIQENAEEINDHMKELLHCLYEIRDEEFVKGALEHLRNVECVHFHQLIDKLDFAVMRFCLANCPVIQKLNISNNKMETEEMRALVPWTVETSSLHFWNCSLSPPCCSELSNLLSESGTLKELVLGYNDIMDSGAAALCEGLRHPGCCIQKLDLCKCALTGLCCDALSSVLRTTPSLEELILADNALGDSGVSQLCEGLQLPQCKLRKLDLDDCSLTGACCGDLTSALSANQSLTELSLRGNKLGDAGMSRLCEALKNPSCRLQNLDLCECSLSGSCCADLSLVLGTNTSLRELTLSRNELGDSGIAQLCQGLKHPGCRLQKLWLSLCSLKGSCCVDLASVLRSSPSLAELSLSDNELGDFGVTALCQGLKDPGCKLQTLHLWCCSFTASCCSDLASALMASPNLTELALSDNKLEDSGMMHLCEGLRHPNCKVQKLELDTAGLTDACVMDLCSALSENHTLQSLSMNCNHFTDASILSFLHLKTNSSKLCDIRLLANDFSAQGRVEISRLMDTDE